MPGTAMPNKFWGYQLLVFFLMGLPATAQSNPTVPLPPTRPPQIPPSILDNQPNPLPNSAPPLPTPQLPAITDKIKVLRYEVIGSSVFSQQELTLLTEPFTGDVGFDQIQAAKQAIERYYIERNYLTTGAYIPTGQTLSIDGAVVKIQVVEGRLEDIKVTGTRRLNTNYIKSRLALATQRPLNNERLLEGLRLLQQDPLVEKISAELSSGVAPGTNLLEVAIKERDSFTGEIVTNNNRPSTVGSWQRRAQVTQANLTGLGDSLTLAYGNTDGSNTIDTSYSVPLTPANTTLTFNAGGTNSQIIEEPYRSLNITSNSRYYEAGLRHPLIRRAQQDATQELAVGMTISKLENSSFLGDTPFALSRGADLNGRSNVTALRWFQEYVQRDNRSVLALRSQVNLGLDILDSTINPSAPDGRFVSWQGQGRWQRRLAENTDLIVQGRLQFADRSLLSVEQFAVGGQNTVRGYRQDALLADNGAFASVELQLPVTSSTTSVLQVAPFIDFGTTWNTNGANAGNNTLFSAGLGLQWRTDHLMARLDWGIPLVNVPEGRKTLQENGLYFSVRYSP
jgi:hemolysin activation/secretion protein